MENKFGQILRELRHAKGLSQRALAEKIEVDFSYISKVENGRLPPPSADTIVKISQALDVAPDELLSLTRKMPTQVKEMLSASPPALRFVRQAQTMQLTDDEWEKLAKGLKRLRSK